MLVVLSFSRKCCFFLSLAQLRSSLLPVEPLDAQLAGPGALWWLLDGRHEAVHVVAAVAVVAEEELEEKEEKSCSENG